MTKRDPTTALLMRVAEVADELGLSREHAYRLVREGSIPSTRLPNGRIVVPRAAFETWLHELNQDALSSVNLGTPA